MTHTRTSLAALLSSHGITPSRALGQNFVVDPNTVRRIARLAEVGPGTEVLEIGAGLGSLSLALVETGATVTAMEVDRHLIEPLRAVLAAHPVRVVHADALHADYDALLATTPTVVVANLPYNIATPLVLHLLETVPQVVRMLVMVQYEVAERLSAHAGEEAYGAASLRVQYFAHARIVGKVSPTVFVPKPKVDSALLSVTRRDQVAVDPAILSEAALFDVVRTAFAHRRKMLRRSLGDWATAETFERASVAPTSRPEDLTLEDFTRLALAR